MIEVHWIHDQCVQREREREREREKRWRKSNHKFSLHVTPNRTPALYLFYYDIDVCTGQLTHVQMTLRLRKETGLFCREVRDSAEVNSFSPLHFVKA